MLNYHNPKRDFFSALTGGTEGGVKTIEERLGEKGGAFFNGKEGRDDFRKTAPEGGYILSLRARERLGERCGILLGRRN